MDSEFDVKNAGFRRPGAEEVPVGASEVKCTVSFMTCNGEMCLPPKSVEVLVML